MILWKSTRFHDKKKTLNTQKKTPDYKITLTHSENAQKLHCNANPRQCATHCKPDKENGSYSSNACVCLYRPL